MRKISLFVAIAMIVTVIQPVRAESYMEWRKRDPEGFYKHFTCTDEESIANGCYSDALNNKSDENVTVDINRGNINKGYVYGDDELHVVGTPSDSRGYTAAGNYTGMPNEGKGWVYDADELHVIGLPTDPETGYTKAGNYGIIK